MHLNALEAHGKYIHCGNKCGENISSCSCQNLTVKNIVILSRIPQIRTKIQRYEFLLILPSRTLKKRAFGNMWLDSPSCGLRRDANSFFFPNWIYAFKFEYNFNFDNILVKNLNVFFQPIWQPYLAMFQVLQFELKFTLKA